MLPFHSSTEDCVWTHRETNDLVSSECVQMKAWLFKMCKYLSKWRPLTFYLCPIILFFVHGHFISCKSVSKLKTLSDIFDEYCIKLYTYCLIVLLQLCWLYFMKCEWKIPPLSSIIDRSSEDTEIEQPHSDLSSVIFHSTCLCCISTRISAISVERTNIINNSVTLCKNLSWITSVTADFHCAV